MSNKDRYIQIGVTALRASTGEFLPAQPLYIKISEDLRSSGLTGAEEISLAELGTLFANKFRQYRDGTKTKLTL